MTLSQEVVRRREKNGWSREELSAATRKIVSTTTITEIENGKTKNPRRATLQALATAFQCSVDDLTGQEPLPVPEPTGPEEIDLLEQYRTLTPEGRQTLQDVLQALVLKQQWNHDDQA